MLRILTLILTLAVAASLSLSAAAAPPSLTLTADQALKLLMDGNQRFVSHHARHPDQGARRQSELESAQHPFAVVLGCADSRVPPEVIFDQGLGDLFVLRVAGNIPDDVVTGSIEYAVEHIGVSLVMVLGHEKCGAVQATVQGGDIPGHLPAIVSRIKPAAEEARALSGDVVSNCVRLNVQHVVQQLRSSEPVLKEAVESGKLKVVGARYDLHSGKVIPVTE